MDAGNPASPRRQRPVIADQHERDGGLSRTYEGQTTVNPRTNIVVLALISLILFAFAMGAYQVNKQAEQIAQLIDDQSPLIFAFQNTGTSGRLTFEVTCNRVDEPNGKYVCTTKQTEPVVATVVPLTPAPPGTPTPTP